MMCQELEAMDVTGKYIGQHMWDQSESESEWEEMHIGKPDSLLKSIKMDHDNYQDSSGSDHHLSF